MLARSDKVLRPDAKGRITLGALTKGISGFTVKIDKQSRIILVPHVEIPASEKWLFKNKATLNQVKQGLKESAEGRVKSRGSFAHHVITDKK